MTYLYIFHLDPSPPPVTITEIWKSLCILVDLIMEYWRGSGKAVLVSFPVVLIKSPNTGNLEEKGFYLTHRSRYSRDIAEAGTWKSGLIRSTVRKQGQMYTGTQLTVTPRCPVSGTVPMVKVCPWTNIVKAMPTEADLNLDNPSQLCPEACTHQPSHWGWQFMWSRVMTWPGDGGRNGATPCGDDPDLKKGPGNMITIPSGAQQEGSASKSLLTNKNLSSTPRTHVTVEGDKWPSHIRETSLLKAVLRSCVQW